MKIAVNTRLLIPNKLEGIGWFTYELFYRITQNHPEHQFYFLFDRKYSEEFIFSKNIQPVELFPQARHPFLFYWWFEYSVPRALKKINADLFISPDGFLSLSTKVKSVNVIHDLSFLHFPQHIPFLELQYYRTFIPKFLQKAERIITVSQSSKTDIISQYQIAANKIDIVPNAAKDIFKPVEKNIQQQVKKKYALGCDYFIHIGILQPRKNIANLLLAFEQFKEHDSSNIKLILVGRKGWKTEKIFDTFQKMDYKNDVVFLDYLPMDELTKLLASSIGLLYLSLFEGFGVPILEAINCDIPIIASNVSSMPEVAGDAALLIDPYSVESIADAMTLLYKDEKIRSGLIEKGKNQRKKFSWNDSAKKMWDSIEKIIS